jgi:hypothetical protein
MPRILFINTTFIKPLLQPGIYTGILKFIGATIIQKIQLKKIYCFNINELQTYFRMIFMNMFINYNATA